MPSNPHHTHKHPPHLIKVTGTCNAPLPDDSPARAAFGVNNACYTMDFQPMCISLDPTDYENAFDELKVRLHEHLLSAPSVQAHSRIFDFLDIVDADSEIRGFVVEWAHLGTHADIGYRNWLDTVLAIHCRGLVDVLRITVHLGGQFESEDMVNGDGEAGVLRGTLEDDDEFEFMWDADFEDVDKI